MYRFSFPTDKQLTKRDAIELSRQALILDGKRSDTMRPVRQGRADTKGDDIFFLRWPPGSDDGGILWWLKRPDYTWEYNVGLRREGNEVVCSILEPL